MTPELNKELFNRLRQTETASINQLQEHEVIDLGVTVLETLADHSAFRLLDSEGKTITPIPKNKEACFIEFRERIRSGEDVKLALVMAERYEHSGED